MRVSRRDHGAAGRQGRDVRDPGAEWYRTLQLGRAAVSNLQDVLIDIDIGRLPASDVRTGYPTPTLLWKGKDIFGMRVPKPPYDVPS